MAKFQYRCVTECVRNDFTDIAGIEGSKRFHVGDIVNSHREIDSPKFELVDYMADPPKPEKKSSSKTSKAEE